MNYQISRNGQQFGPYTLADVQRYVGTGNILLTDLALAEGSTDWIPVSQVVGSIAVAPLQPTAAYVMPQFPDPPNLHWALVLLFAWLSCGIFAVVWEGIQSFWIKKVDPNTKVVRFFFTYIGLYAAYFVLVFGMAIFGQMAQHSGTSPNGSVALVFSLLISVVGIGFMAMLIVFRFTTRTALLQHFNGPDPVGLQLSGVMTFFFGALYFQYHLTRINQIKQAYRIVNPGL